MVSKGRRAERSLNRARPHLTARPRILVVCEGITTEPEYFEDLKRDLRINLVDVIIDKRGGVPKTLVERAVEEKKRAAQAARRERDVNLRYEEIWCVYDVDEHPKLLDARHQAEAHGIKLAISNPSFELWFLLHFQDQHAHIERGAARSACRSYMPRYMKQASYNLLAPRYQVAVARASALAARHERDGQPGANPSTDVHRLTARFHEFGRAAHLQRVTRR